MKNLLTEIRKLFSGSDGQLSLRRILGVFLIVVGVVLLIVAERPVDKELVSLAWSLRGIGAMVIGLFLIGLITIQNIKDIAKKGIDTIGQGEGDK
jgi:drug/metabolite transporter (DMT)-like permease